MSDDIADPMPKCDHCEKRAVVVLNLGARCRYPAAQLALGHVEEAFGVAIGQMLGAALAEHLDPETGAGNVSFQLAYCEDHAHECLDEMIQGAKMSGVLDDMPGLTHEPDQEIGQ